MNWFDYIHDQVQQQFKKLACCIVTQRVSASDPTPSDIKEGGAKIWKNTSSGTVKLYYNDGGTLKSVSLS